jgi:hypothetical protein
MEEAFNGCRDHGKHQKAEDDPVRNAHFLICNAHAAN